MEIKLSKTSSIIDGGGKRLSFFVGSHCFLCNFLLLSVA